MTEEDLCIHLKPWLLSERMQENRLRYYFIEDLMGDQRVALITIGHIGQEMLTMFGRIVVQQRQALDDIVLIYLSQPFMINQRYLQIAYVPNQSSSLYHNYKPIPLIQLLQKYSQHTLTNPHTQHTPTHSPQQHNQQQQLYALINSNDIFQVKYKDNRMQLIRRIQMSSSNQYHLIDQFTAVQKAEDIGIFVNLNEVKRIMDVYLKQFGVMLNNDKNWTNFTYLVLTHSRLIQHLETNSNIYHSIIQEHRYCSPKEILQLNQELSSLNHNNQCQLFNIVISSIEKSLQQSNRINLAPFLLHLKNEFNKAVIGSQEDFVEQSGKVRLLLLEYSLGLQYLSYIVQHPLLSLHLSRQNTLQLQLQQLQSQITTLNSTLTSKHKTITQYHHQINQFQHLQHNLQTIKVNFKEICNKYEDKQQENQELKEELSNSKDLVLKGKLIREELEGKCGDLGKEKKQLLGSIKQMTKEHLDMINQMVTQRQQVKILKDKVEESHHIQARALRSVQNQAEIKVRLSRYQTYVHELKQCMHTFKTLQTQKFNYILSQNLQQFDLLSSSHKNTELQLLRAHKKLQEMSESLQCQKLRVNYFQKMYINNYHNQPIFQVSQEDNSATDRSVDAH